jgi:protein involved in temperature-dependent protein secretion
MINSRRAENRLKELYKQLEHCEKVKNEVLTGKAMEEFNDNRIKEIKEAIIEIVSWFVI